MVSVMKRVISRPSLDEPKTMGNLLDGSSNTFLAGEMGWQTEKRMLYPWIRITTDYQASTELLNARNIRYPIRAIGKYDTIDWNDVSLGSEHPGGLHFLLADGSVHFFRESTELKILQAFATRGDGETASLP